MDWAWRAGGWESASAIVAWPVIPAMHASTGISRFNLIPLLIATTSLVSNAVER
jgi:hypothetical protein